ncbi:MAG: type IV pilus modification protein PilV [Gallionellales bacterium RBG_16_57_15]|nr:MAG: type IV pilus modification protein PilV [Gallionellales bacterium RBG_16_57_15]
MLMIGHHRNTGFSMIEVLITIVILMIGLLGLAGLQTKALTAQMEAYQRSQALILLKDMVDRISANRKNALSYVTELNPAASCPTAGATVASVDLNEWCNALLGAAEVQDTAKVGAMIGARGCITQTVAPASGVPSQYLVAVAWQGLNSTAIPAITCGQNQYGNEALRRVVALPVTIADLL